VPDILSDSTSKHMRVSSPSFPSISVPEIIRRV
jgi:hypothetical protein